MGQLQWVNQWGTAADERVWELEFAPNGSVWAAEAKGGWGAETAIHLVKFDVCGNECRRFEVVTGRFDFVFVRDFHIDEFGFLFLTATPCPYGTSFVGMYDDCGREYWSHTIAEANASIHLMGIATNRCGQVFVVGTRQNSRGFSYGPVLYEFDYRGCQKNRSLVEQYGHLNRVSVDSEGRPFAAGWGWGSEEARPDDEALRPLILPELAATPDDIAPAARGVTPLIRGGAKFG